MRTLFALTICALTLAGCGGVSDNSVVAKVQAGVAKSCGFLAEYKWLTDVVAKMDVTAATVDAAVKKICQGVSAQPQGLMSTEKKCPNGEIVINDEPICIEGERIGNP